MLSHKRDYAEVLGRPTTSQLYAFLQKFSVRSGHIQSMGHRTSHHDRLSGEEDISLSLGRSDTRMVMLSDRAPHVPPSIADMGYTDSSVGEDSPTYALSYSRRMSSFRYHSKSNR